MKHIRYHLSKDEKHYFTVHAANGECLVTSEMYESEQNARHGAKALIGTCVNALATNCHAASKDSGWWNCPLTGEELLSNPSYAPYVVATKIALMHSELSEGLEGYRKNLMDDKLTIRPMIEVELADVLIRVLDLAERLDLDVGGATVEKMNFNAVREDHKMTARRDPNGKKF